ncbi:MAG: helix-turn-helix transcriptional regulator [Hyphomicrobium sp.]
MPTLTALSGLIGRIYDCALEPKLWPGALSELCDRLDAKAASIHTFNPIEGSIGLYIEHGGDPKYAQSLIQQYAALSPTGTAVLLADIEQPVGVFDLIDEEEFRETRFFREWCAPQGYYDMLAALIAKRPSEISAIAVTRLETQKHFGAEERQFIGLIAPHVRRAVTIAGMLDHRAQDLAELASAIDKLSAAVIVTDATGAIHRTNAAADALLAAGDGIAVGEGRIKVHNDDARNALKTCLDQASAIPRSCVIPIASGSRLYAAVVKLDGAQGRRAIFLKVEEPEIPAIGKHLMAAFAMTTREVSVVMPLLHGKSPLEIADSLGISMPTVRTHLQRLFKKTNTQSQTDLVRVVLQSMPPIRLG